MELFSKSTDVEEQLENLYVPTLQAMMGMSSSQAKSAFHDMLKKAKEDSQKEGTSTLIKNFGNMLLEKESTNADIKSRLLKIRREGVRAGDIRWWWNRYDLERRMMIKVDELYQMAMFNESIEKGMKTNEAAAKVRKFYPIYGDPDDTSHTSGDDRTLPYELKDRINIYIQKRAQMESEEFNREMEMSSTFNALIRNEIKKGEI